MLKIAVVDRSAESRSRIIAQINSFLSSQVDDLSLMPQVSLKPLSPEELKFHAAPDICIIGEEIVTTELTEIGTLRKLLPNAAILVRVTANLNSLSIIEQIARMGADDTISDNITAHDFLRKVILLSRRIVKPRSGTLIVVDSGKGGIGVTSVAAGLAEGLLNQGKRVLLIDMDFESQDLSRFLQARPFVNENLQLLFNGSRPITHEFVEQTILQIWQDEPNFCCVPPVGESEDLYDSRASYARIMLSIIEIFDSTFDCVVVDVGSARGALLKTLYRVADKVVFLVNNDPATLYASVDKLQRVRPLMAPAAQLMVVENSSLRIGLSNRLLREEFSRAARLDIAEWLDGVLPFCREGCKWPGSGSTPFSCAKDGLVRGLQALISGIGLGTVVATPTAQLSQMSRQLLGRTTTGDTPAKTMLQAPRELLSHPAPSKSDQSNTPNGSSDSALRIEDHGIRFTRRSATTPADESQPDTVGANLVSPAIQLEQNKLGDGLNLDNLISGVRVS